MPVDNDEIMRKVKELEAKGHEYQLKIKEIEETMIALKNICEEVDPTDPEKKRILPIKDKGTGQIIKTARRQEVYDSQIIKADSLLS